MARRQSFGHVDPNKLGDRLESQPVKPSMKTSGVRKSLTGAESPRTKLNVDTGIGATPTRRSTAMTPSAKTPMRTIPTGPLTPLASGGGNASCRPRRTPIRTLDGTGYVTEPVSTTSGEAVLPLVRTPVKSGAISAAYVMPGQRGEPLPPLPRSPAWVVKDCAAVSTPVQCARTPTRIPKTPVATGASGEPAEPPAEIRCIVDKTAEFVAQNGLEFEQKILSNEKRNPKFNFLKSKDVYHSYYQRRILEFINQSPTSGVGSDDTYNEARQA